MKVSLNGGASWAVDTKLTAFVTASGEVRFDSPIYGSTVHVIAFDPTNSNTILVGSEDPVIAASFDNGQNWQAIVGNPNIANTPPAVTAFFFDELKGVAYASSYGRGLWQIGFYRARTSTEAPPKPTGSGGISTQRIFRPSAAAARRLGRKSRSIGAVPYLQLVGTNPAAGQSTVMPGDTVKVYGSGFCHTARCSRVTVRIGDRILARGVRVGANGTFRTTLRVTETPGGYIMTASQKAGRRSIKKDFTTLVVAASEARGEIA